MAQAIHSNNKKICVGDKVVCINENSHTFGKAGVVYEIIEKNLTEEDLLCVKWENFRGGHGGGGLYKGNSCWNVRSNSVKLLKEDKQQEFDFE